MYRISKAVKITVFVGTTLFVFLQTANTKGASNNAPNLVEIATKKLFSLREAERIMFRNVINGEIADCSDISDKKKRSE